MLGRAAEEGRGTVPREWDPDGWNVVALYAGTASFLSVLAAGSAHTTEGRVALYALAGLSFSATAVSVLLMPPRCPRCLERTQRVRPAAGRRYDCPRCRRYRHQGSEGTLRDRD